MNSESKLINAILDAWQLNNRISVFLIENLPKELWSKNIPGYQQKTSQMIGGHLHNTRCSWIKKVGKNIGIKPPEQVNRYRVSQKELIVALRISSEVVHRILKIGIEQNNKLPRFSLGAVHFANYLIAHEAHHRGQIIMIARQLEHNLPQEVIDGVWKWPMRSKEMRHSS